MHGICFSGFPKEFVGFLFSLKINNTVDKVAENKLVYKQLITEPLTQLFNALTPTALSISETIITKPAKCMSSMYSDMRFSRATPLKEYMYLRFREPVRERDILGLYFDMGTEHYSYGIRIYKQTSAGMEKIRNGIAANEKVFAQELGNLTKIGMMIHSEKYARDRFPDIKNDTVIQLLNSKHFYIGRDCIIGDAVFNGEMLHEISNAYHGLKALYQLLKKSLY